MGRHEPGSAPAWLCFPPPSGPPVALGPSGADLVTVPPGPHELVTIPPAASAHVLGVVPGAVPEGLGGRRARRLAAEAAPSGRHARSA